MTAQEIVDSKARERLAAHQERLDMHEKTLQEIKIDFNRFSESINYIKYAIIFIAAMVGEQKVQEIIMFALKIRG